MTDAKILITEYLQALSGKPKPPALVRKYVSDPSLTSHIADVEAAFPNYEIIVEAMVAEADKVAVRGRFRGVHSGTYGGMEATGRTVSAGLMIIYRVENERIAEHWMELDRMALLQQLQGAAA